MSRSHRTTGGTTGPRTIDQLAQEQGILAPQDLTTLIGAGADLWETEADFNDFTAGIERRRKEGLAIDAAKVAREAKP